MTTALAELDQIISLLEAELPGNQRSPKNLRLRKRLEREVASYFRKLERAFPYSKLGSIYNRNVKESLGSETRGILDPLLATFNDKFQADMSGQLTEVYLSGQAEMITWGKTKGGIPIAYEGPPIAHAINWAERHGATLVTQMAEETQRRLALTISNGIAQKRGIPGLARDIRTTFSDMTKYRSELIARTETASALSQASLDTMTDMGIDGKEWITVGDDRVSDECRANEAEGIITVDKTFSGGTMAPPQHPDAVFEGYGFFPYGSLSQMVSARYEGASITFEVERIEDTIELPSRDITSLRNGSDRDITMEHINGSRDLLIRDRSRETIAIFPQRVQLAIGPNHPILTRRGFVNAQFLNEGEELIYDGRREFTAWLAESHFKQVYLIEDVFESVASIVDYTDIPTPSNYFHGDKTFCHGEIKVIRPKRYLLQVGDISFLEHLSKCDLTDAYADAVHIAGCRSCQSAFEGIFTATAGSMSSGSYGHSHGIGLVRPPFLHTYRLINTHKSSFIGMAFDASTSTELYNIGGIVVKNCRCALAPAKFKK